MAKIDGKCKLGLVKGHYFINGYTELTSYCLEHYEEIQDIKDGNKTFKKFSDKYKKCNDIFIKAFQVLKILIDTVGNLVTHGINRWSIKHTILW